MDTLILGPWGSVERDRWPARRCVQVAQALGLVHDPYQLISHGLEGLRRGVFHWQRCLERDTQRKSCGSGLMVVVGCSRLPLPSNIGPRLALR